MDLTSGYNPLWLIFIVWIVLAYSHKAWRTFHREKSRREIAAYIAEGSLSADQGEKLMRAGEPQDLA
ncbi:MAG: hypothetical protein C0475_05230 [Planctomyces sp.]|nr:hypothetical protein [Planctomyces sp.]MBA4038833.1 hypothetical protein [Planctomyces sp.]MBA4120761.1 hypothetical protein [Isosphaera sp.]